MADYATIEKSWAFSCNQNIAAAGSALATMQNLLYQIVHTMLTLGSNPWVCRGSSDGSGGHFSLPAQSAGAGTNYWASGANLIWNGAGAHSWIVLRNTALGPGYPEILIPLNLNASGRLLMYMSPSLGFQGGSTTVDPFAADAIMLAQGGVATISFGSNTNVQNVLHMEQSNDGQCTRVWVYSANVFQNLWILDKAKNPVSGWTSPWVVFADYNVPSSNGYVNNLSPTYTGCPGNPSAPNGSNQGVGNYLRAYWTGEQVSTVLLTAKYNAPNDLNSKYPMPPIGMFFPLTIGSYYYPGRHGMFYDLWWGCLAAGASGTLYAGSVAHAYVVLGEIIVPWDGSAAMNTT